MQIVKVIHKLSVRTVDNLYFILVGIEHNVGFHCCQCEPGGMTMVRARLWPATPQFPCLAFTFELLDWAEALLPE